MRRPVGFVLWIAAALLAACAAGPDHRPDPLDPGQLLVFSGFTVKIAASQEELEQLGGVPQRELLRVAASNPPLYIWVDGPGCRCYYVGDEGAYRRLEALGFASAWK
jgi:hypothetical protein